MMNRYIRMPLKKALPLLFIGALLLSCTLKRTSYPLCSSVYLFRGNAFFQSEIKMYPSSGVF